MGSFFCAYMATQGARRRFAPSLTGLCFAIFAVLALASSWRSFNPPLSAVKGVLLLAVLGTGYLTGQTGLGQRYFQSIYWCYTALLGIGLLIGLLFPHQYPLFMVDDFSGRTKLSLFSTHPGVMSECCALLLLLAPLFRARPHWLSQWFLLGINFAAGEKASTGVLLLFLLVRFVLGYDRAKVWRTLSIITTVMLVTGLGVYLFASRSSAFANKVADVGSKIYGTNISTEVTSLDGRTELWRGAIGLLSNSEFLGYGLDGSRELLMKIAPWSGQSHNGFIEVALESGLLGVTFFVVGLAGVVTACLQAKREFRNAALPALAFVIIIASLGSMFNSPVNFGVLCLFWLFYQAKANAADPVLHTALRTYPVTITPCANVT